MTVVDHVRAVHVDPLDVPVPVEEQGARAADRQHEQAFVEQAAQALEVGVGVYVRRRRQVGVLFQEQLVSVQIVSDDVPRLTGRQSDHAVAALGPVGVLEEALPGDERALESRDRASPRRRLKADVVAHPRHRAGLGSQLLRLPQLDLQDAVGGLVVDPVFHRSYLSGSIGPRVRPNSSGLWLWT